MTKKCRHDLPWLFHFRVLTFFFFPLNFPPRDAHCFWQWASKKGGVATNSESQQHQRISRISKMSKKSERCYIRPWCHFLTASSISRMTIFVRIFLFGHCQHHSLYLQSQHPIVTPEPWHCHPLPILEPEKRKEIILREIILTKNMFRSFLRKERI